MKTILIIEDNDTIRENTAEILELANYQVLTAENGKRGVEIALKTKPDLVICDIMMPVMDGYGVLHVFTKHTELATVPFIFLSAKTDRADIRKGMQEGADDYITKPFLESELLSAIESRLRKAELLKKDFHPSDEGLNDLIQNARQYKELESLADDRKTYTYKKKQLIYLEGNDPTKLFFIKKGKIKTFRSTADGKEFITDLHTEGAFFGYRALLENTEYQETAEAMEESELVLIPKEDFSALINQNPYVANRLIKLLANNVTEKEKQLSSMAYNSLRKRTAESLLFLQKKYEKGSQPTAIQISRDDIASIVGASTESLIRTLSDFKSEKLIDIVEGKIVLLNEKKLQTLRN